MQYITGSSQALDSPVLFFDSKTVNITKGSDLVAGYKYTINVGVQGKTLIQARNSINSGSTGGIYNCAIWPLKFPTQIKKSMDLCTASVRKYFFDPLDMCRPYTGTSETVYMYAILYGVSSSWQSPGGAKTEVWNILTHLDNEPSAEIKNNSKNLFLQYPTYSIYAGYFDDNTARTFIGGASQYDNLYRNAPTPWPEGGVSSIGSITSTSSSGFWLRDFEITFLRRTATPEMVPEVDLTAPLIANKTVTQSSTHTASIRVQTNNKNPVTSGTPDYAIQFDGTNFKRYPLSDRIRASAVDSANGKVIEVHVDIPMTQKQVEL